MMMMMINIINIIIIILCHWRLLDEDSMICHVN